MSEEQRKLQVLSDDYQRLQGELQSTVEARQKLESQQQENKGVQKEFAKLEDDANIYKLVGPVLLKQDKNEAVVAVDGRLEFIEKEIKRVEKQISDTQEKSENKKMEVSFSHSHTVGDTCFSEQDAADTLVRVDEGDGGFKRLTGNGQIYQLQTSIQQQQQPQIAS